MPSYLTEPVTFTAGRRWLEGKANLPTDLSSAEIAQRFPESIRRQAFFSAKVASADILQALRSEVESIARGDTNYSDARMRISDFLANHGYGIPAPGAAEDTDIRDLASTSRLDLILRTNVAMAHTAAQREVSENQYVREIYPNYEYRSAEDDRVRPEHAALNGLILSKDDPFWKTHYPPWDFGCRCMAVDTDEPARGQASGFAPKGDTPQEQDDSIQTGRVVNGTRSVELTPNASGFVFNSDPAVAFDAPDFSRIEDTALREQVRKAFARKFAS